MAGAAARPAGRRRLTVRVLVGVRGLERLPRRARRAGRRARAATHSGRANGYWIEDWERAGGSVADQVRFEREWTALRAYARERGIGLIGDVPIYVAQGSVDHLAHPELFLDGLVAGAPPDPLGPLGQHWGNPLFDWDAVAKDGYRWWIERLRRTLALFDLTRIDHFRGFADFWAIPEDEQDARTGHWLPGPGRRLFRAAEAELGPLPVIAEDLGLITPDVEELRDALGFPGMVVILWAVDRKTARQPAPVREPPRAPGDLHDHARHRHAQGPLPRREPWELIELALSSRPALCMIPAQDVLGLGSEGRMNTPGEPLGNWTLAARARPAHGRARRAPARGDHAAAVSWTGPQSGPSGIALGRCD